MNAMKLAMIATAACLLTVPAALAQSRTDPAGTTKANGMTPDSTKPGASMSAGSGGAMMKSSGAMSGPGSESGAKSGGSGSGTGSTASGGGTKN